MTSERATVCRKAVTLVEWHTNRLGRWSAYKRFRAAVGRLVWLDADEFGRCGSSLNSCEVWGQARGVVIEIDSRAPVFSLTATAEYVCYCCCELPMQRTH